MNIVLSVTAEQADFLLPFHCQFGGAADFVHVSGAWCMEQIQAVTVACNVFFNWVLHGNTHVLAPAIWTLKTNKIKHPTTAQKNPGYAAQQKCLYP